MKKKDIKKWTWRYLMTLNEFWQSKLEGNTPKHFEFDFWCDLKGYRISPTD